MYRPTTVYPLSSAQVYPPQGGGSIGQTTASRRWLFFPPTRSTYTINQYDLSSKRSKTHERVTNMFRILIRRSTCTFKGVRNSMYRSGQMVDARKSCAPKTSVSCGYRKKNTKTNHPIYPVDPNLLNKREVLHAEAHTHTCVDIQSPTR